MFAGDFSAAWLDAHDAARIMRGAHHLFMFRLSLQVCKDHASLLATLNGYRCAAILTAKIRIFSVFGSLPPLHRQVLKPASLALGSDLCVPTRQLRGYFLQSASISQHRSVQRFSSSHSGHPRDHLVFPVGSPGAPTRSPSSGSPSWYRSTPWF